MTDEVSIGDAEALLKRAEKINGDVEEIIKLHNEIMMGFDTEEDLQEYLEWEIDRHKAEIVKVRKRKEFLQRRVKIH
jgi:hypothetical protein